MNDNESTIGELKERIAGFTEERDWRRFHDLKNLSMALVIEASELMEHFRWVSNSDADSVMDDAELAAAVREEVADVLLFLTQFANVAGIDLMEAAEKKLKINEARYPIDKCKGIAT